MIDPDKLDELLKQLTEMMGSGSSDEATSKKAKGMGKHRVTVMTVEAGKGIKLPKAKKKQEMPEMSGAKL